MVLHCGESSFYSLRRRLTCSWVTRDLESTCSHGGVRAGDVGYLESGAFVRLFNLANDSKLSPMLEDGPPVERFPLGDVAESTGHQPVHVFHTPSIAQLNSSDFTYATLPYSYTMIMNLSLHAAIMKEDLSRSGSLESVVHCSSSRETLFIKMLLNTPRCSGTYQGIVLRGYHTLSITSPPST
jgi:hypothetical protein